MLSNLTIKVKVLALALLSLFILAIAISSFSINELQNFVIKENFAKLTSTRDSKATQITNFFNERVGDIKVLSESQNVKNAAIDFTRVNAQIDVNIKGSFPIENQFVKELTKRHEEYFQTYMKEYGYYDIFLIDAANGHVVYTAAKESDYGENLSTGSLKSSGLGEVWKKVQDTKKVTFVDMKPYAPSNGSPAMFLGAPVYVKSEFTHILVLQISDAAVNKIMQFREGYGNSQEDYLVGSDKLMRSDSYLDPTNHSLKASFSNPSKGSVDTQASRAALNGESDTKIIIDYNGNPVLSAYSQISIGENLKWAILSEIDEAETLEEPNYIRNLVIIISLVMFIIIALAFIITINQILVKPLNQFQEGLISFFNYLNRKTNEVKLLKDRNEDEIGTMAKVVNENIQLTQKGIEEDRQLIDETISVLGQFEQGDLHQRLQTNVSNPSLMELKNVLNKMGNNMEKNIENVLDILGQYANYNYMNKIDTKGLKEHLRKLANGVNNLGESTTQMLIENKANGLTLDKSSDILLENVDQLNVSSTEAASSLEETAAAIEEITSNIRNNTENIVKMSNISNNVTSSANEGEALANKTTLAMEEINAQVADINEAISVIDQIAFQTNILSLNAAVEAATAGEAGKGFAVVAQEVRNLASRSAEAAKEIKNIVENATNKANDGKQITASMIEGYKGLSENIVLTTDLIKDIESASKEQLLGIEQINNAVNSLDQQTQQNAMVASQTHDVAVVTDEIAKLVVSNANAKEFKGKNEVKAKPLERQKSSETQSAIVKKEIKKQPTSKTVKSQTNETVIITAQNNQQDDWESF